MRTPLPRTIPWGPVALMEELGPYSHLAPTEQGGARQASQPSAFPLMVSAGPSEDLSLHPTGFSERRQDGGSSKKEQVELVW